MIIIHSCACPFLVVVFIVSDSSAERNLEGCGKVNLPWMKGKALSACVEWWLCTWRKRCLNWCCWESCLLLSVSSSPYFLRKMTRTSLCALLRYQRCKVNANRQWALLLISFVFYCSSFGQAFSFRSIYNTLIRPLLFCHLVRASLKAWFLGGALVGTRLWFFQLFIVPYFISDTTNTSQAIHGTYILTWTYVYDLTGCSRGIFEAAQCFLY